MPKLIVGMNAIFAVLLLAAQIGGQNAPALRPGAAISGRVLDAAGQPIANATISTFPGYYYHIPIDFPDGRHEISHASPVGAGVFGSTKSNDRGEYRFDFRPVGEYFLCIQIPAETPVGCNSDSYGPTYYPGTLDASKAAPLDVRAGADLTGIDFVVKPQPKGVRISGSFVGPDGKPLAPRNPDLVLVPHTPYEEPLNGRGVLSMSNAAKDFATTGHYEIRGVPPGTYDLVVRGQGESWGSRTPLVVGDKDIENLSVVLRPDPDVKLEGRVLAYGANGTAAPFPYQNLEVRVFGDVYFWKGGQMIKVDATGKIGFDYVPEGNYALRVRGLPPNAYVSDIRQSGKSIYDGARFGAYGIKMTPTPGPIEVIVGTAGGTIEGIAVDSQQHAVSNVTVTLAPVASSRQNPYLFSTTSTPTDATGHFSLTGIAPGSYKVFAWENIPPAAYLNPEYLTPHEKDGVAVKMESAGRVTNIQVKVIPDLP